MTAGPTGVGAVACHVLLGAPSHDGRMLDAAERARARAYRRHADRCRFIAGRSLAKALAGEIAAVDPHEVTVRLRCVHCGSDEHGKPAVVHRQGTMPLSIAHAGDLVVVAVTSGPAVGVDVERIEPRRDLRDVAREICSPLEPRDLVGHERFYRSWTSKEAILKCTGDGLSVPMRHLTLAFDGAHARLTSWSGRALPRIVTSALDVPPPYIAACAVATDGPVLVSTATRGIDDLGRRGGPRRPASEVGR